MESGNLAVIIVSACLVGLNCRYKGDSCLNEQVMKLKANNILIPVCPEQLGGLPTPRNPSERVGDKVLMNDGTDVTAEYTKGAEMALKIAKITDADFVVLKENSPSCGSGIIYDGSFTGCKINGYGVTAELFKKNGIRIFTESDLEE